MTLVGPVRLTGAAVPASPTEPLRVAVLVESLTVPEWVRWTLERLDALGGCDLTAVVPSPAHTIGWPCRAICVT